MRFTALKDGEIDVLIRNSTLTFTRGTQLGLNLAGVNFYAGQGFMVKTSLNAKNVKDLNGATICILAGATLELNIADYNRAHNVKITPLLFDKARRGDRRRSRPGAATATPTIPAASPARAAR